MARCTFRGTAADVRCRNSLARQVGEEAKREVNPEPNSPNLPLRALRRNPAEASSRFGWGSGFSSTCECYAGCAHARVTCGLFRCTCSACFVPCCISTRSRVFSLYPFDSRPQQLMSSSATVPQGHERESKGLSEQSQHTAEVGQFQSLLEGVSRILYSERWVDLWLRTSNREPGAVVVSEVDDHALAKDRSLSLDSDGSERGVIVPVCAFQLHDASSVHASRTTRTRLHTSKSNTSPASPAWALSPLLLAVRVLQPTICPKREDSKTKVAKQQANQTIRFTWTRVVGSH